MSNTNSLKSKATFLRSIFGNSNNNDGSSDDESQQIEDQDYIDNGVRGIIVTKAYCVKTEKNKVFHIHLYSGVICQYVDKKKKVFHCNDIQSITFRQSDRNFIVESKKNLDVSTKGKRYIFDTDENGFIFKKYIEYRKEYGNIIKSAFDLIDRKGSRIITLLSLKAALHSLDIRATDEQIAKMLSIDGNDGTSVDFYSFFHYFFDNEISSIRECIVDWMYRACNTNNSLLNISNNIPNPPETLQGEEILKVTEKIRWSIMSGKSTGNIPSFTGTLYITNYRIILTTNKKISNQISNNYQSRFDLPKFFDIITIPLSSIYRINISQPKNALHIISKDYRHIRIVLSSSDQLSNSKAEGLIQLIEGIAFYSQSAANNNMSGCHLFAFKYRRRYIAEGWNICDIRQEFIRQGLIDHTKWQLVDNSDWTLIETYPAYIILPAALDIKAIKSAVAYRSKGRLPAVTYRHVSTDAIMSRSAQPLVGITLKNNKDDEKLLDLYRLKGVPYDNKEQEVPSKFYIFDARRQIAATLNMAAGKGTEDISTYTNTDLIFCDIDNIHVMRASVTSFADTLLPGGIVTNTTGSSGNNNVHMANGVTISNIAASSNTSTSSNISGYSMNIGGNTSSNIEISGSGQGFYSKLEESGWLRHIKLILKASLMVAEKMHLEGASVLVHCSDGWDRTSQICCVAQLLLDPFYRTIDGFAVLIEKDWCSFGHKFQDRFGHGEDHNHYADERSPVFLQFLDAVHQLVIQFPVIFEFNLNFLVFLADHSNSGLFGNFLGNCDKQRSSEYELNVHENTRSIWSHVSDYKHQFLNRSYVQHDYPVWPSCSMSRIAIWHRYFSRWDHEAHPNQLVGEEWHDDWGNGFETQRQQYDQTSIESFGITLNETPNSNKESLDNSIEGLSEEQDLSITV